jgi:hypothetical protein
MVGRRRPAAWNGTPPRRPGTVVDRAPSQQTPETARHRPRFSLMSRVILRPSHRSPVIASASSTRGSWETSRGRWVSSALIEYRRAYERKPLSRLHSLAFSTDTPATKRLRPATRAHRELALTPLRRAPLQAPRPPGRKTPRTPPPPDQLDFIKVCRVSWPTNLSPSDGGAYAQL